MPGFDDRLTRELERVARPASGAGTFERVDRRRARRARLRKGGSVGLAVVVIVGILGGVAVLRNAFREGAPSRGGTGAAANGAIVVARDSGNGSSLWVTRAGTVERRLTTGSNVSDTAPAISPDGERVAFVRVDEGLQDLAANGQIWSIDIGGSEERSVSPPGWIATEPAWSPDGSRIAYVGADGSTTGVFTMTPDGTDLVSLISDLPVSPDHPTWSPDGRRIAFAAATEPVDGSQQEPLNWDLYTVEVATGAIVQLTDTPRRNEMAPSWAPSGDQIVFTRVTSAMEDGSSGGLALIAPDGTGLRQLTSDGAFEQNPTWSPDGSLIAFDRDDPQGLSVYTIAPDGTGLTRVTLGIDPAWQPVLSSGSVTPSPSATPPSSTAGDITGFAFPVCNPRGIAGDFDGNGTADAAYVVTKMSDAGGCPQADQAENLLAVDLDGDGVVDAEGGPIGCELDCIPLVATDLNVDGDDELFVAQLVSSIVGLTPYELIDGGGGPAMVPITFAPPGDPRNDLRPDEPPLLYIGGDEGFAARLGCNQTGAGAVLTALTSDLDSIEQPTTWTIRRTEFRMDGDHFVVLDSGTSQEPVGDEGPFGSAVDPQLCGVAFPDNGAFPGLTGPSAESIDIGLGFRICNVSSAIGDWGGDSSTIFVGTKVADDGCPPAGTATEVMAIDTDGDGLVDASAGPIPCESACRIFGLPDVDGDHFPEIAVVRSIGQAKTEVFFDLYRVEGPMSDPRVVRIFYDCTNCGDPGFPWGGPGGHLEGAYCSNDGGGFLFTTWTAEVDDGGASYALVEIVNRIDGHVLVEVDQRNSTVPLDRPDLLPSGGGAELCGYPVEPAPAGPARD